MKEKSIVHTPTGFLNNYDPLEKIVCAALWLTGVERHKDFDDYSAQPFNIKEGVVITGWRHNSCYVVAMRIWDLNNRNYKIDDGFLTSHNRYVDRKEGLVIANKAGQLKPTSYERTLLFSEDLY